MVKAKETGNAEDSISENIKIDRCYALMKKIAEDRELITADTM